MLPAIVATKAVPNARVLLLGKQDLYFTYEQLTAFFKQFNVAYTEIAPSDRRVTDSFGFVAHQDWWQYRNFMHQETFFRMFGFAPGAIHTLDVDAYEGAEIIHDMNLPLPPSLVGSYDLVIDVGTIEHIFDLKQAFWNLHDLVKVGGHAFHISPSNMLDHGFINLNAVLIRDYYTQSGWQKEELFYIATPNSDTGNSTVSVQIDPDVYSLPPDGFYLGVVGRFRKTDTSVKLIPKQGLYVGLHDAWTRQSRAQSRHEPPPKTTGDEARSFARNCVKRLKLLRALWAAKRLKGRVTLIRQPFSD